MKGKRFPKVGGMFGYASKVVSYAKELTSVYIYMCVTHRGMAFILPCRDYYLIMYTQSVCVKLLSVVWSEVVLFRGITFMSHPGRR